MEAFAKSIGYDKGYVSRLENGKCQNPSNKFLAAVCARYQLKPQWFHIEGGPHLARVSTLTGKEQFRGAAGEKIHQIKHRTLVLGLFELLARIPVSNHTQLVRDILEAQELTQAEKLFWTGVLSEVLLFVDSAAIMEMAKDSDSAAPMVP